jgi:hypothetical protein
LTAIRPAVAGASPIAEAAGKCHADEEPDSEGSAMRVSVDGHAREGTRDRREPAERSLRKDFRNLRRPHQPGVFSC